RETYGLMGLGVAEAPVLGLVQAGRRVVPELEDQVEDSTGDLALLAALRIDADHLEITGEPPGAHAPVEAAPRHLVELRDALREHEGTVIRQAGDPGPELHRSPQR